MFESVKQAVERISGLGIPAQTDALRLVRRRKPWLFGFNDDGETPNHPIWPLVLYRSPVLLREGYDPAAVLEVIFKSNGWRDSWRNGVYDFLHFHTRAHEALGIARGSARVEFGGAKGRVLSIRAGDVVVLPAGVGHRRVAASRDLLVVGAYPARSGKYDEPRPSQVEHAEARKRIAQVKRPRADPVFGKDGPLLHVWRRSPMPDAASRSRRARHYIPADS